MENVGGVHSLKSSEGLVDEVLAMVIGEVLSSNDAVHVCLHQFLQKLALHETKLDLGRATHLDQVNLRKRIIAPGLLDIKDTDDVLMVEVPKELHLTQSSQAEH
jgi:hypothetical protein